MAFSKRKGSPDHVRLITCGIAYVRTKRGQEREHFSCLTSPGHQSCQPSYPESTTHKPINLCSVQNNFSPVSHFGGGCIKYCCLVLAAVAQLMDVIPYTKRLLAQSMVGSVQLNDVVLSHQCFSLLSSSFSKNQVTILKSIYSCLLGKIRIFNGGISSTDLPETPFFLCILRNLLIPSSPFLKIYYGNVKHTEVETSITNSQESITQFREPTFYFIIS